MFRKTMFVGLPLSETCCLVLYDFKGAQCRDKNHRYLDADRNKLRGQFYEQLRKLYPDLVTGNATDSAIEVGTLNEAERIYDLVIEHKGTVCLYEANRLRP